MLRKFRRSESFDRLRVNGESLKYLYIPFALRPPWMAEVVVVQEQLVSKPVEAIFYLLRPRLAQLAVQELFDELDALKVQ
jgi:hypothetical protein